MRMLCTLIILLVASAAAAEPLGLEEAIREGLAKNFGVRIARESAAQAEAERALGRAALLPRLDASAGWQGNDHAETGNSSSNLGDTESQSWSAGLSLSWTIFDGFDMFVERGRYADLARLGEASARAAIEGQVLAIGAAWLDLVGQELLLDVTRETREISAARLEQERIRHDLGGLSSAEFLTAQVDYNTDHATYLDQELRVQVARQELNRLLGRAPGATCEVSGAIPLPPLPLARDSVVAVALERNSTLAGMALSSSLARRGVAGARAAFWPELSLNIGYDYRDYTLSAAPEKLPADIESETEDLTVGLRLDMTLFDGFRKRTRLRSAKAEARIAALELVDARRLLETDALAALATWERRLELVELEEENVRAASRSLELQEERYRSGAATSLEFRDAQLALARARSALVSARLQARLARLEIERLTGLLPAE